MENFALVTDSSCDLPEKMAEELELTVLPLSFTMGGKEYRNTLDGREMPVEEFYRRLRAGEPCTTAAVNVGAYVSAMEPLLKEGRDVLNLAFSSGLSNTFNAAQMACRELAEKYPQRRIRAVDTLAASMGQGLLVYHAALLRLRGKSLDEVRTWVERNRLRMCHWFTVDDLNHLHRGGRISAATALFGTMLNIKPVLHVDDAGHLVSVGKARGRRASLDALVDRMEALAENPQEQIVFISHGDAPRDAEYVAGEVKRRLGVKETVINFCGPVIGAHSGPGTLALFFLGKHR
ncbi:MAG TPA: fatty acid-binding protein DegV [Ruminococcaceae bacterium]|nr:fatty acid-binding protein DegV [Oscillospiraceae bacterium]